MKFIIYFFVICGPVKLEKFYLKYLENYHSVILSHYKVPIDSQILSFRFIPYSETNNCPTKDVNIFIQYKKYPTIWNNYSAHNFWYQNYQKYFLKTTASYDNYNAYSLNIQNPLVGVWFIAAFLSPETIMIKQKGLSTNCRYALNISHAWNVINVVELIPNIINKHQFFPDKVNYFKFYAPKISWRFQINITFFPQILKNAKEIYFSMSKISLIIADQPFLNLHNDQNLNFSTLEPYSCSYNETDIYRTCIYTKYYPKSDVYYYILLVVPNDLNASTQFSFTFQTLVIIETCLNKNVSEKDKNSKNDIRTIINKYKMPKQIEICQAIVLPLDRFHLPQYFTDGFYIQWTFFHINTFSLEPSHSADSILMPFYLEDYIDNGLTLVVTLYLDIIPRSDDSQGSLHTSNNNEKPSKNHILLLAACVSRAQIPNLNLTTSLFNNHSLPFDFELSCHDLDNTFPLIAYHIQNPSLNPSYTAKINLPQRRNEPAFNINENNLNNVKVPYPMSGQYFLYVRPFCTYNQRDGHDYRITNFDECFNHTEYNAFITFNIKLEPCISIEGEKKINSIEKGSNITTILKMDHAKSSDERKFSPNICGGLRKGKCQITAQQSLFITGCQCLAGWKGVACSDGTRALSKTRQIINLILLTFSNFMFLPAIYYSLSIRFYSESAVYMLNMMSSMFYHACDEEVIKFCLLPYEVLQYMDFYTSILSTIVTVHAISTLDIGIISLLNLLFAIVTAFLVQLNRLGLWTFLGPLIVSCFILLASWIWRSYATKKLFPPKNVLLKHIIPGIMVAFIGLLVFAFAQTEDNYPYIHSLWHIMMSISILILLTEKKSQRLKLCQSQILNNDNSNIPREIEEPLDLLS
ncbi:uncharacterized protein LOC135928715 [Gordionus sp. m RMFG-2023]|uniref:uncharacterized protein LOC135928715 n=1 Tax=Gordionus sp. m RMFG-2023 TaxID=3053472 RepID=UPI0031FE340B